MYIFLYCKSNYQTYQKLCYHCTLYFLYSINFRDQINKLPFVLISNLPLQHLVVPINEVLDTTKNASNRNGYLLAAVSFGLHLLTDYLRTVLYHNPAAKSCALPSIMLHHYLQIVWLLISLYSLLFPVSLNIHFLIRHSLMCCENFSIV